MNIEEFREYCLSIKGATECFPYNDTVLVFKVMGKVFAEIPINPKDGRFYADMKCDPERSVELREKYQGIGRGLYTTYLTWNGIYLESDVPDSLIRELIQHSVDEVIKKLPKRLQEEYNKAE